jgi:hypothetical protein
LQCRSESARSKRQPDVPTVEEGIPISIGEKAAEQSRLAVATRPQKPKRMTALDEIQQFPRLGVPVNHLGRRKRPRKVERIGLPRPWYKHVNQRAEATRHPCQIAAVLTPLVTDR